MKKRKRLKRDLKDQRFGKLLVIERDGRQGHNVTWKCQCDCGNISSVMTTNLVKENGTRSCGCMWKIRGPSNSRWKGFGEISGRYWYAIRHNAKSRNIEFDLTIEYIWDLFLKQNRKCALTGIELNVLNCGHRNVMICSASLDRIDSTKGYTQDNVWWIHKKINQIKMDIEKNEFIYLCHLIVKNNPINDNDIENIASKIDWNRLRKVRKCS